MLHKVHACYLSACLSEARHQIASVILFPSCVAKVKCLFVWHESQLRFHLLKNQNVITSAHSKHTWDGFLMSGVNCNLSQVDVDMIESNGYNTGLKRVWVSLKVKQQYVGQWWPFECFGWRLTDLYTQLQDCAVMTEA